MHHLPRFNRSLLLILPLAALLLSACAPQLLPVFSHQGRLTDENGVPVADGDYEVIYSIFHVATGGTAVHSETQTVTVEDGLFTTSLGMSAIIPADVFAQPAWLEVSVDGEVLTPRQRLQGAPFAFSLSSGSVAQGAQTLERTYLTVENTGSTFTAVNLDATATGGHGIFAINRAAPAGDARGLTAAIYGVGSGGLADSSDGVDDTGSAGAIFRSQSYRGMFVQGAAHTDNPNTGYYAAVFTSPAGISVEGGGNCVGCTMAYTALNTGNAPIRAGDFVAVSGVVVDPDLNIPVMQVRKATSASDAVIGVATGALARTDVVFELGMPTGGYDAKAGDAAAGDYVTIVVQGLVQARAADTGLQPGAAVTLSADGVSAASGAGIARAMSAVDASGMVWVMVDGASAGQ